MFERYTEKARRAIFFSRYEASQFGSPYIEPEHLLLGLLREDRALANRFLRSDTAVESIREQIEDHTTIREKIPTSVDLPLSHECTRVLAYAAEEVESLSHEHLDTAHLLLGLLREEKCFAAGILRERGLSVSAIREELCRVQTEKSPSGRPQETSLLRKFGRDLTQAAMEGQLHPLVDRDNELRRIIRILCRRTNNNPVLIGEPGVVNSSIMEGLAQRIVDGNVPSRLEDKRIVSLDISMLEAESSGRAEFTQRLRSLINELSEAPNVLIFIEELFVLMTSVSPDGWLDAASIVKPPLLMGALQCMAATTPLGYSKVIGKHSALTRCFQEVRVVPANEAECIKILIGIKEHDEKFHGVTFDDDAIAAAVVLAKRDMSERSLLIKAADLLDEAGAHVQIRRGNPLPQDIRDLRKRIKVIGHHMENAIASHEFDKARSYSDEERRERAELRGLHEKYQIDMTGVVPVTRKDIEEVVELRGGTAN